MIFAGRFVKIPSLTFNFMRIVVNPSLFVANNGLDSTPVQTIKQVLVISVHLNVGHQHCIFAPVSMKKIASFLS